MLANLIMPTLDFKCGDVRKLPYVELPQAALKYGEENIALSKLDWDSLETSWDFKRHPLL